MNKLFIDLTGQQIGRWKVIERAENNSRGDAMFLCECSCNKHTIRKVLGKSLRQRTSMSCGCLTEEASAKRALHNQSGTRIYRIWRNMKERCGNPNNTYYNNYGGRGICVCEEWKNDFVKFFEWANKNGYQENLTIDRINNNKDYCPENCRWVTRKEQSNNTRKNKFIEFNNERHTMSEWSSILNISYMSLCHRLGRGWSIERAFTTPQNFKNKKQGIQSERFMEDE